MKKTLVILIVAGGLVLAGCGSDAGSKAPGYTKDDFKKSGPPPEYRGPGQPGGPPSGPIAGPDGKTGQ